MANISVTYTFSNSTTADASQVNQNFTDIINGTSDGTKDLSISALTCAGAVTLNGNVTLGNATADDITITGSLAATIPIKTNNSFDIGSSTLGLAGVYLGSAGGLTTRLIGGATGSSWSFTFPTTAGTDGYYLATNGSGVTSWKQVQNSPGDGKNYSLACSVASSALTITLNGADGNALSSTNAANIVFRNSTAATGTPVTRSVTSSPTLTVSSGSTLGTTDGNNHYLYVYALDNSGTVELAISQTLYSELSVQSTTAEGGGGAADSNRVIYSTTARSNVPMRLLGRLKSNQTTAGTWASVPTEISLVTAGLSPDRVKVLYTHSAGTSISNATYTTVDFANKVVDSHNSVATGTWLFTAPRTAVYLINACATFSTNATGDRALKVRKNGSDYLDHVFRTNSGEKQTIQASALVSLTAGDTLDFQVYQNSGGSLALYNNAAGNVMSIHSID
jgi:hypothetical protein